MVSIKDIAARANVSIGTVDRVLHNRGRVSDATREKVDRIVQQVGYRPNIYARNLSLAKEFSFGVLMPRLSQDSGYWRIPARGIERAARELANHKVAVRYYFFDRYSERSFERAFNQALKEKSDGLLVAPVLPHVAEQIVPSIPKKTPFVFFDSILPDVVPLSAIGQDSFQSGLLASYLMQGFVRAGSRLVVVRVNPSDFHIEERIRGFLSSLRGSFASNTTIVEVDSHQGERAFRSLARSILSENTNLGGVFVSNAWVHPIARLIHNDENAKGVCIIGYDLIKRNIKYLEQGLIDFLISQRPEMQGYEGIYCLYEHVVLREEVGKKIVVPIDILTKENVKYYQD
jgi:LacI family transcriptional regulator